MKTITGNTEAEIVEKRSKFISNLYYVETVEQAENKLKRDKKRDTMMLGITVLHIESVKKTQL